MRNKFLLFYLIIVSVVILEFLFYILSLGVHFSIEYEPLHSAIEIFGVMSAIFMAVILLQRQQEGGSERLFWLTQGLLTLGLTNVFHAITRVGRGFVFLHSVAYLAGSFWFMLTWLPEFGIDESAKKWTTKLVVTVSIIFGIWSLFARQTLPVMVREGEFTTLTIVVNLLAGVFFILATVRLLLELYRYGKPEFYFFSGLSLLFGLSEFTYPLLELWGGLWWFWHLQRLLAYLAVAWFVIYNYLQMVSRLKVTIAERKKAEEEVRDAYNKLKETQMQLIHSSKMASLGQLASGMAHEINNPLTGVLNSVQLIKDGIGEKRDFNFDSFKRMLDNIEESAIRCRSIVQSLLDFSYYSRGPFTFIFLNELIEKTIVLMEAEAELEKIIIQRQLQEDLPQILGNAQQLQQVIVNLLSNARWAIKESKKESGIITIKTQYEAEKNIVLLSISDNGIGIPKENLDKIFDPFFTTKNVGEGTGLGLYVIYGIIEEHKGSIEVESEVGKGAIFKISLPCILEKAKI